MTLIIIVTIVSFDDEMNSTTHDINDYSDLQLI